MSSWIPVLVAKVRIMVAADPQQMVLFHWKAARFPVDDWSLQVLTLTFDHDTVARISATLAEQLLEAG